MEVKIQPQDRHGLLLLRERQKVQHGKQIDPSRLVKRQTHELGKTFKIKLKFDTQTKLPHSLR